MNVAKKYITLLRGLQKMEIVNLNFTRKEFNNLLEFYLGKKYIFNFCYENSKEFKAFIDNCSEERLKKIKKLQTAETLSHANRPLWALATCGATAIATKAHHDKQLKELANTIQTDSFKTLFSNFDLVLLNNNLSW